MKYIYRFLIVPIYYIISRILIALSFCLKYVILALWHLKIYMPDLFPNTTDLKIYFYFKTNIYIVSHVDTFTHKMQCDAYTSIKNYFLDITEEFIYFRESNILID